jgi:peptide deformylase
MVRDAVQIGNPIVRRKSKAVGDIKSKPTQRLVRNLIDSMRVHELVGMAAPQIGVNLRVFVTELRPTKIRKSLKDMDAVRVFINPRIIALSKQQTVLIEGCGSLLHGQLFGPVRRPQKVTVEAFNEKGERFTLTADKLLAKVIQHEHDHLEGIICLDKFTDTRKVMAGEEYLSQLSKPE